MCTETTVMLACRNRHTAVGTTPPVQLSTMSPISSVKPSERSAGVTVPVSRSTTSPPSQLPARWPALRIGPTRLTQESICENLSFPSPCKFRKKFESVEVLFQPEPRCQALKPFSQPRELLRVGRRVVVQRATKPAAGLFILKPYLRHMMLCFCLLCSQYPNTKLPLKPDAVKIFITDCPSHVKRNSFPSTRNGVAASGLGAKQCWHD